VSKNSNIPFYDRRLIKERIIYKHSKVTLNKERRTKMKKAYTILVISIMLFASFLVLPSNIAQTGGPDSFGYTYIDSNEVGGPVYNWVEISGTGTQILPDSDDDFVTNIPLGFFFNYYGSDYSQVAISNNGVIFSGVATGQFSNQAIGESSIHGFIAPFWDDIVTWGSAGAIYYQTLGTSPNRMFVVEWYDNQGYSSTPSGATFEAIMCEGSNFILFQYQDVDFGGGSGYNSGGSATVGIESPDGLIGLQYSYNQPVLTPGLAILFKFAAFAGANMYLSMTAPSSIDHGQQITYNVFYNNFGREVATSVGLHVIIPAEVNYVSSSTGSTWDSTTRTVSWNLGDLSAYPNGRGSTSITVFIPSSVPIGTVIEAVGTVTTTTIETRVDDNTATAQTTITGLNLPDNVAVGPILGTSGTTPTVYWGTPVTFTYTDALAISVDILIHINDGGADIVDVMAGPPPTWTYTVTFYPRHGLTTVTYTPHYANGSTSDIAFNIYIDPAGYIYDINTDARISGATVWLQRPDGVGGWENVPTGQDPAVMQPDTNPLTTAADGQYEWLTLAGTYRVHVEAPGYTPADSRVVNVPPPVFDLHVGLTPAAPPADAVPPTTTLTIGQPSSDGYVEPTTPFTLQATDATSGVSATAYRIIGGAYDSGWQTYTTPFQLNPLADGAYTIRFNSTDVAGNVEATNSTTVTLFRNQVAFQDTRVAGCTLGINVGNRTFHFVAPGHDFGVRTATFMRVSGSTIDIIQRDADLTLYIRSVGGRWDFCTIYARDQTGIRYFLLDTISIE
jgi:uncharacterized repeat protein (TIGR01451 family)